MKRGCLSGLVVASLLGLTPAMGWCADFRSVAEAGAIFYDAPTTRGKKLFVVSRDYPVEVLVNNDGWSRVRDASGELAWVERKSLAERRTVLVTAAIAEVRSGPSDQAAVVFRVQQGVALELPEGPNGPWARVKLRDGRNGFVRLSQIWGV